jgi:hypothetical protein
LRRNGACNASNTLRATRDPPHQNDEPARPAGNATGRLKAHTPHTRPQTHPNGGITHGHFLAGYFHGFGALFFLWCRVIFLFCYFFCGFPVIFLFCYFFCGFPVIFSSCYFFLLFFLVCYFFWGGRVISCCLLFSHYFFVIFSRYFCFPDQIMDFHPDFCERKNKKKNNTKNNREIAKK